MKTAIRSILFASAVLALAACSEDPRVEPTPDNPVISDEIGVKISTDIERYDGRTATDIDRDKPTSNTDFFWEASSFPNKVELKYTDNGVTVKNNNALILIHTDGAYVTVDAQTNNVAGIEIIASGTSSDGSLKIYGNSRTLLTLDGLDLTSRTGPAINNQNKKRLMVHLKDRTTNRLADAETYSADKYYLPEGSELTEDRKGCLFSEGHLVFSGSGVLRLRGNNRHGIVTDGYLYTRPGVTLVVDDAIRNAIHVKGDATDGIGVNITGGYIYAYTSGDGGRAIKCDLGVTISGGELSLNTSGDAVYDKTDLDLRSAAGIKASGNINIRGGVVTIHSTGKGGKGLNSNSAIYLSADKVTITASGEEAEDTQRGLSSSPKGVKADGNCMITSGDNLIYAMDDAVSALSLNVNGGRTWIYSIDKDGIDVENNYTINNGLIITLADGGNSSGIDAPTIDLRGGTTLATGGRQTAPTGSVYPWAKTSFDAVKGNPIAIKKGDRVLMTYILPRSLTNMAFLYSSPDLADIKSVTLYKGGTANDPSLSWSGLTTDNPIYKGGTATKLNLNN